jgi:hypothetical protein
MLLALYRASVVEGGYVKTKARTSIDSLSRSSADLIGTAAWGQPDRFSMNRSVIKTARLTSDDSIVGIIILENQRVFRRLHALIKPPDALMVPSWCVMKVVVDIEPF